MNSNAISIPLHRRDGTLAALAFVDLVDADLAQVPWCLHSRGYAIRFVYGQPKRQLLKLHNVVYTRAYGPLPPGFEIDHRDLDRMNNRRENLRLATRDQNVKNRPMASHNTSGFKGVTFVKLRGNWLAQIVIDGAYHYLGHHSTREAAYEAYKEAATRLHGEFARV